MDLFSEWIAAHNDLLAEQLGVTALLKNGHYTEGEMRAAKDRILRHRGAVDRVIDRAIRVARERAGGAA